MNTYLASALVTKENGEGRQVYGHRAAIVTGNSVQEAKGTMVERILVNDYVLADIVITEIDSVPGFSRTPEVG